MSEVNIDYPNVKELRDVINENLKQTELLEFLRGKGVFYFNASHDDSSMLTARLLFDGDELKEIHRYAYRNSHSSLLSGFTLVSNSIFDLESIYNTIREREVLKKDGYKLKTLRKVGNKLFEGKVEYKKKRPGRTAFLKYETREISFRMGEVAAKQWQVEIDGDNSSDGKVIQQLFKNATRDKEITMEELLLDSLGIANTITFFDRLAKEGLDNEWAIEDVLRLTLKKSKEKVDDEDEEAGTDSPASEEEIKEAPKEQLSGISQAILEGKNLRENPFVHLAEQGGYIFSSMTYLFVRNKDNSHITLRAEFKGNPKIFEVSLEGYTTVSTAPGEDSITALTEEQNYQFRTIFWNSAKKIYNELRRSGS